MQIIADVTGYPVFSIEQDVEAAMGAVLLAALALGSFLGRLLRVGDARAEGFARFRPAARLCSVV